MTAAPSTVGDWLAVLDPPPPAALATRLRELLAHAMTRPAVDVPAICLAAGEEVLKTLLESGATARGSALDLLAVDALVTYAFQASADFPEELELRAKIAMSRIAELPYQLGHEVREERS